MMMIRTSKITDCRKYLPTNEVFKFTFVTKDVAHAVGEWRGENVLSQTMNPKSVFVEPSFLKKKFFF